MVKIFIDASFVGESEVDYANISQCIRDKTNLQENDFYLLQNGKVLSNTSVANSDLSIQCILRNLGGKGGFGSMLRAIGAQIEKTTNREACRDLSGRRLRDINEEKRLKSWLEKQADREREAEERKKKKIEKLLHVPKHEFKDEKYEETRSKLTEKVNDAVEEGFKKVATAEPKHESQTSNKRKASTSSKAYDAKKKKGALWIDDGISESGESSCSSDDESHEKKNNNVLRHRPINNS